MSISPDDAAFSKFCECANGLPHHNPSAEIKEPISASSSFEGPSIEP